MGAVERAPGYVQLELRAGMPELLRRLHDRGPLIGLAANQPLRTIAVLDRLRIGRCFSHREVSAA